MTLAYKAIKTKAMIKKWERTWKEKLEKESQRNCKKIQLRQEQLLGLVEQNEFFKTLFLVQKKSVIYHFVH